MADRSCELNTLAQPLFVRGPRLDAGGSRFLSVSSAKIPFCRRTENDSAAVAVVKTEPMMTAADTNRLSVFIGVSCVLVFLFVNRLRDRFGHQPFHDPHVLAARSSRGERNLAAVGVNAEIADAGLGKL